MHSVRGGGVSINVQQSAMPSRLISGGSHSCMSGTCNRSCAWRHSKNACIGVGETLRYLLHRGRLHRGRCSMERHAQRTTPIENLGPQGCRNMEWLHQEWLHQSKHGACFPEGIVVTTSDPHRSAGSPRPTASTPFADRSPEKGQSERKAGKQNHLYPWNLTLKKTKSEDT